jgi:hypothetical protein
MSRYDTLTERLQSFTEPTVTLSFEELDEVVGGLPPSAKKYPEWWANKRTSQAHAKAWLDAGRRAKPDFGAGHVVFTADATVEPRYWIFQPIRSDYQLPSEIATKEVGEEDEWPVIRNAEDMHPGDQVMFYQMRSKQGVYACGELISEPYVQRQLNGAYAGTQQAGEQVVRVRYTQILPRPFNRTDMTRHSGLSNMQMMRSSDCINCRVTPEEWDALQELVDRASKPRFWWVNQGTSFEQEVSEGYIRAPQENAAGNAVHFYTNVTQVRPGDVLLHYARKSLRAVGRAIDRAQETTIPDAEGRPADTPGWLVHVDVSELDRPIDLDDIPVEWRTAPMESGPFNYQGGVNQGYLFALSPAFMRQFLSGYSDRLPAWTADLGIADDGPANQSRTILKVAPGEQGKYWGECREGGFICVGWEELNDLRSYGSELEIRSACLAEGSTSHEGTATLYARALWAYRNLQPGDIVLANRGQSTLLGIGQVKSGYEYRPDRPYYKHVVPVRWDTSLEGPIPDQGPTWRHTIVELSPEQHRSILAAARAGEEPSRAGETTPNNAATFQRILSTLEQQGLHFAPESVSNYLLALQAKRFVILTGISGTGKTQLAMAVARAFQPMMEVARPRSIPDDAFARKVVPSMFSAGSMALPVAFTAHLHLPPVNPATNGGQLRVEYPRGASEQTFWKDPNANRIDLSFSGEFRQWFNQTFAPGDQMLMTILRQEGDAPDAIRIDVPQKEKRTERLENYRVVAVRPDWTDNRGLLGYYNPITESYVSTEFLRLLLAARAEEERARAEGRDPHPFFLILDEMNLARVEHYFSDFLSALESGEPIDLHDDPAVAAGEGEEGIAIPRRLEVPGNVFFTGTVNVDETTYMFSPKVLDRAFTIEFNQVDLAGFGAVPLAETDRRDGLRLDRLGSNLEQLGRPRTADWNALARLGHEDEFRRAVVELNRVLVDHGRHFGYRVANEIARLVTLAARQAGDEEHTLWTVLDLAILQKVLPKFHGTQQELESALAEVFAFAVAGAPSGSIGAHFEDWALEGGRLVPTASGDAPEQPRLPRTATKVWRMLDRVRRQGFAAYVE